MQKDSAPPRSPQVWTRIDDYAVPMRRRQRAARHRVRLKPRTEPESPRFGLSTLPFVLLLLVLLVLMVSFAIAAWPGRAERRAAQPQPASAEFGTAPSGWLSAPQK